MGQVFMVIRCTYSDYRPIAVYSIKEQTKALVEAISPYDARVEKIPLDEPPERWYSIAVTMDRDCSEPAVEFDIPAPDHHGCQYFEGSDAIVYRVHTADRERAIKVTNETRSRILAWGLWPNPGSSAMDLSRASYIVCSALMAGT